MTMINSQLNDILLVFQRQMDAPPDHILQCPQPKDWNHPTNEEVQAILDCAQRTNEYADQVLFPKLDEMDVAIEDMDHLSDQLKERHRKYKHEKPIIFTLAEGVYLAISSVGAMICKTNRVVASVMFTDGDWRTTYEKYRRPVQIGAGIACSAIVAASVWIISKMINKH